MPGFWRGRCAVLLVLLMHYESVHGLSATSGWQLKPDRCPAECVAANTVLVVDDQKLYFNPSVADYGPAKFWPINDLALILADPVDGCTAGAKPPAPSGGGAYALVVKRGTCAFAQKAWVAQQQGAALAIILNTKDDAVKLLYSGGETADGWSGPDDFNITSMIFHLNGDDGKSGTAPDAGADQLEKDLQAHAAAGTQARVDVTCPHSYNDQAKKLRERGGTAAEICATNLTTSTTSTTVVVNVTVALQELDTAKAAFEAAGCGAAGAASTSTKCVQLQASMAQAQATYDRAKAAAGEQDTDDTGGDSGANMGLIIGISSAVLLIGLIIVTCAFAGPKIADAMAYREVTRVRPVKTTMNAVSAISAFNLGKKTAGGTSGWAAKADAPQPQGSVVAGLVAPSTGSLV